MHRPMLPLRLLLVTDVHMLKQLRMTNTAPFLDETVRDDTLRLDVFGLSRQPFLEDPYASRTFEDRTLRRHCLNCSVILKPFTFRFDRTFIELRRYHFVPRSSFVFHATSIFHHPRISQIFPRKTTRYDFHVDQRV